MAGTDAKDLKGGKSWQRWCSERCHAEPGWARAALVLGCEGEGWLQPSNICSSFVPKLVAPNGSYRNLVGA